MAKAIDGAPDAEPRSRLSIERVLAHRLASPDRAVMSWLDAVRWNADGLVAAIAQDAATHKVLTLAWMNREALERTAATRRGALLVALARASSGARASRRDTCSACARSGSTATATRSCSSSSRSAASRATPAASAASSSGSTASAWREVEPVLKDPKDDLWRRLTDDARARAPGRDDRGAARRRPRVVLRRGLLAKGDDAILKKIGEEATETVMASKDGDPGARRRRDGRPLVPLPRAARAPRPGARRRARRARAARGPLRARREGRRAAERAVAAGPAGRRAPDRMAIQWRARSRLHGMHDPNCIFCKIVARRDPVPQGRTRTTTCSRSTTSSRSAPVHVLVVPKKHIATMYDCAPGRRGGAGPDAGARAAARARAGGERRLPHDRQHRPRRPAGSAARPRSRDRRAGAARADDPAQGILKE